MNWKSQFDPVALRFVGLFLLFALSLTLFVQIPWIDENVMAPYTGTLAAWAGNILHVLGIPARVEGTRIGEGTFAVDVRRGCDGVVASILLVSACLAYPFSWTNRLLGTVLGFVLIFALNMVRIVGLFLLGWRGSARTFDFVHVYVSQFAIIAVVMVFWVYWAGRTRTTLSS